MKITSPVHCQKLLNAGSITIPMADEWIDGWNTANAHAPVYYAGGGIRWKGSGRLVLPPDAGQFLRDTIDLCQSAPLSAVYTARNDERGRSLNEYRTCAHLHCLRVIVGPPGALCDDCAAEPDEKVCCPYCDNDTEEAL